MIYSKTHNKKESKHIYKIKILTKYLPVLMPQHNKEMSHVSFLLKDPFNKPLVHQLMNFINSKLINFNLSIKKAH